jgi:hypothetical protein
MLGGESEGKAKVCLGRWGLGADETFCMIRRVEGRCRLIRIEAMG